MGERALTVRDNIIVHLAAYARFADEFECPEAICQAGISKAIGKSRAHTTLEVNRMKQDGLLNERLAHVKGARSKRKTYSLTPKALAIEKQISDHIRGLEVDVTDNGQSYMVNGARAAEILESEMHLPKAMAVNAVMNCGGAIDLDEERRSMPEEKTEEPKVRKQNGKDGLDSIMKMVKAKNPEAIVVMGLPGIGKAGRVSESSWAAEMDTGDEGQTTAALILRANILSRKGRPEDAVDILDKAIKNSSSDTDRSRAHYARAAVFRKIGNLPMARRDIEKAMATATGPGQEIMVARCNMEKAMVLSATGDKKESLALLAQADKVFKQEDSQLDILRCGINQGIVLRSMGELREAVGVLEQSLSIAEKTGMDRLRAYAMVNLSDLLNDQGEFSRSREMASDARDIFSLLDEPLMLAAALFNLGTAEAGLEEKQEAIKHLDRAVSILEDRKMLASRTAWLEDYAAMLEKMGEPEMAEQVLKKI